MEKNKPGNIPAQEQERQPGFESEMEPKPDFKGNLAGQAHRLPNKTALITGGDSGIGRSIALAFAKEGADVAIAYLDEHEDAEETKKFVEQEGRRCLLISGDLGDESFCKEAVEKVVGEFAKLDILDMLFCCVIDQDIQFSEFIDHSSDRFLAEGFISQIS